MIVGLVQRFPQTILSAPSFDQLLVLTLSAAFVAHLAIGHAPVAQNMMDIFTFIDGAHRIRHGQIPHVDFISSLGSGTYLIYLLASYLGPWGMGVYWSNFVFFVAIAPLLIKLPDMVDDRAAKIYLLAIAIAVFAPVNTDFGAQCAINYNTGYNRWGATLLLITFLMLASEDRRATDEPVSIFLLLSYALLLKMNFFVIVLGAFILRAAIKPAARRPILFAAVCFATAIIVVDLTTGAFRGYLRDLALAAAVNQGAIVPMLIKVLRENLLAFGFASVLVGIFCLQFLVRVRTLAAGGRLAFGPLLAVARAPLVAGFILCGTAVSESQNLGGIGPFAMLALAAVRLSGFTSSWRRRVATGRWIVITVVVLPWLFVVAHTALCFGRQIALQRAFAQITDIAPLFPEFAAHRGVIAEQYNPERLERDRGLRDWVLHRDPRLYVFYLREVSEAANALRADYGSNLPANRTMDFADPFPALLKARPTSGAYIALHQLRTISTQSHVPPDEYFKPVRLVLVPNCYLFELNPAMLDIYRPYLDRYFSRRQLTRCWSIYER